MEKLNEVDVILKRLLEILPPSGSFSRPVRINIQHVMQEVLPALDQAGEDLAEIAGVKVCVRFASAAFSDVTGIFELEESDNRRSVQYLTRLCRQICCLCDKSSPSNPTSPRLAFTATRTPSCSCDPDRKRSFVADDAMVTGGNGGEKSGSGRQDELVASRWPETASSDITFADVVGHTEAKQTLKEAVLYPSKFPNLFNRAGGPKPWKCVLLYGPPGTGKSKLAEALSNEGNMSFLKISSSDLISKWVGESEKMVRQLFQDALARCNQSSCPVVIFIDEIDSLCRVRRGSEEDGARRIKTELLIRISEIMEAPLSQQVFLLGATNSPWDLDTAFLRRFQKRIYVRLPSFEDRLQMLKRNKENYQITAQEWSKLAELTDGLSGSDIACLCQEAAFAPVRALTECKQWVFSPRRKVYVPATGAQQQESVERNFENIASSVITEPRPVFFEDFASGLGCIPQSVSAKVVQMYEEFSKTSRV